MKKFLNLILVLSVLVFIPTNSWGDPINLHIISDSSWLTSDTLYTDWNQISFDDSSWDSARSPYPNPTSPDYFISGTTAEMIWHDPNETSDGTTGPNEIWLRRTFDLDIQLDSLPLIGQALMAVDDGYEFFVNGNLVQTIVPGDPWVQFVDFTSYLHTGQNVFALHAYDGYSPGVPQNRSYEWVLFDGSISTVPIPEPATILLVSSGLIGLAGTRKKYKK